MVPRTALDRIPEYLSPARMAQVSGSGLRELPFRRRRVKKSRRAGRVSVNGDAWLWRRAAHVILDGAGSDVKAAADARPGRRSPTSRTRRLHRQMFAIRRDSGQPATVGAEIRPGYRDRSAVARWVGGVVTPTAAMLVSPVSRRMVVPSFRMLAAARGPLACADLGAVFVVGDLVQLDFD